MDSWRCAAASLSLRTRVIVADRRRVPQLNEWMGRVMENGKDLTDAEFETSLEAWTALIKHKKAREAKPGE